MANNVVVTLPAPMPSQQDIKPTIAGGHPASPEVLPGGKVISTTLSVTGDTPGH